VIIDAHCHVVPSPEGADVTLHRMREAAVDHTLVVPGGMIPAVGLADYLRGTQPLQQRTPDNGFILDFSKTVPDKISALYHFDPAYDEIADAEEALSNGYFGFKLSPLVDRVSFPSPILDELFRLASIKEVPIYTHIVLAGDASLPALAALMTRHPDVHLILGHMGFASSDGEAISTAFRFENMMLETSVGAFQAIQEAHRKIGATKIVFGSEGPAHHPAVELRKIELLYLSSRDFEDITFRNIARFLPQLKGD
jgi:uncharacterized protein